jgi:hypothetical protein
MSQIDFKRLFGILFTVFIFMWVSFFILVVMAVKQSIVESTILIILPLIIRYLIYKLIKI